MKDDTIAITEADMKRLRSMSTRNTWEASVLDGGIRDIPPPKNVFEFSLDDEEADLLVPTNGRQRQMLRAIPGLKEVSEFLRRYVEGVRVLNCEFSWIDDTRVKNHHRPIQVHMLVANPDPYFLKTGMVEALAYQSYYNFHVVNCKTPGGFITPAFDLGTGVLGLEAVLRHILGDIWRDLQGEGSLAAAAKNIVYHEIMEKDKELHRSITASIESGEIRQQINTWYERQVGGMVMKALGRFSDLPHEMLHRFVDELMVKEVLET